MLLQGDTFLVLPLPDGILRSLNPTSQGGSRVARSIAEDSPQPEQSPAADGPELATALALVRLASHVNPINPSGYMFICSTWLSAVGRQGASVEPWTQLLHGSS